MAGTPSDFQPPEEMDNAAAQALLTSLRRKEGTWLDWGDGCQRLQKAGLAPQQIFEGTGIEPIHQNQIIVAAQVFRSILGQGVSEAVQTRFAKTGSDSLYEFRVLDVEGRVAAAELVVERELNSEASKDVARALKDFSRLSQPPEAFPEYPTDAVAYHYWRLARQQGDLQERSRLIAQGLQFAASPSARKKIEKLLTDFTVTKVKQAPILPTYRLETASEVPRIVPVAGKMPMSPSDLKAVPMPDEEGVFRIVKFSGSGAWVALPGWQAVYAAEDPVALIMNTDDLPVEIAETNEEVLVLVDRSDRTWNEFSYFLQAANESLSVVWSPDAPEQKIVGRVLLVLRPQRVLDEDFNKELWQLEE
jgi:hypothetical protein